jgi:hypothetical protein
VQNFVLVPSNIFDSLPFCRICRKNVILADCLCQQEICSSDYTENTADPVYRIATRHLQQAMVPGQHLVSVHLCDGEAYEQAMKVAATTDTARS